MKNTFTLLRSESGMTLVELIVVIIILGVLAATVGPRVFKTVDRGKASQAKHQIGIFKGAIDMYRLDTGKVPSTSHGLNALVSNPGVDGWDGPYLDDNKLPDDPWNNPYSYKTPGSNRDYEIISYGANKAPGGDKYDADITN